MLWVKYLGASCWPQSKNLAVTDKEYKNFSLRLVKVVFTAS